MFCTLQHDTEATPLAPAIGKVLICSDLPEGRKKVHCGYLASVGQPARGAPSPVVPSWALRGFSSRPTLARSRLVAAPFIG